MSAFRSSRLYRTSLGEESPWTGRHETQRLVTALERFRTHAAAIAARIAFDLPDFTSHDVSHIDALWLTADEIAPPDYRFTPTEAFVFGSAALVHDLGLAVAAYVDGVDSLTRGERWEDALLQAVSRELGRAATHEELDEASPAARRAALAQVLRQRHAAQAAELATASLQGPEGPIWLLEDQDLRLDAGWLIGTIAASHWWDASALERAFANRGSRPKDFPAEWTIDPLTLACLLRLADAAHLDGTRARTLAQALQAPTEASQPHWTFQRLLQPVRRHGDQLVFESVRPFKRSEAEAWWLCLDTLRGADRELRAVDALLADSRSGFRFAAKSVAGVDHPARLAELVHTDQWIPIDARLHVSDLPSLVERLGGRQLYGDEPHVSLREIIQNAQDAVRARAAFAGDDEPPSGVLVSEGSDEDGVWRAVTDDGVGMPVTTLTGSLLDFGMSGWQSTELADRLPGLLARGFRPTGRFGIGFTAVFMNNRRVQVVSRALDAGAADTNVLEFLHGTSKRPLLRPADPPERRVEAGTTVRMWPAQLPRPSTRLPWMPGMPDALPELVTWLCPATQTDVSVQTEGSRERVAEADDWQRLTPAELLKRVGGVRHLNLHTQVMRSAPGRMRMIEVDGVPVGRAALVPARQEFGVITVGGLRAAKADHVAGLLLGHAPNLARDTAIPHATQAAITAWATEQRDLLAAISLTYEDATECAAILHRLGVPPGELPICRVAAGPLTFDELTEWSRARRRIMLFDDQDEWVEDLSAMQRSSLVPGEDVVVYSSYELGSLSWFDNAAGDTKARPSYIRDVLLEAILAGWGDYLMQEEDNEPVVIGSTSDGVELQTEYYTDVDKLDEEHPMWEEFQAEREYDVVVLPPTFALPHEDAAEDDEAEEPAT